MRFLLILVLIALAGVGGWFVRVQYENRLQSEVANEEVVTSTASAPTPKTVRGIGKLEPLSGIYKIYAPQGERIDSLYGRTIGDPVNVGDAIVKLAGLEMRQLELDLANARMQDATNQLGYENSKAEKKKEAAQLAIAEAESIRDQIEAKGKGVELLKMQLDATRQQLQRLQNLKANSLTTKMIGQTDIEKQKLLIAQLNSKIQQAEDEIRLGFATAERAEQAARVELTAIEEAIENSYNSVPGNSIQAAIDAAKKAVELSEIKSPVKGRVLDIVVRPGDTATTQPVLLLGDTEQMVCIAEINDVSFRYVKNGAKVTISSVALESTITGEVLSRGVMIGPPSMKDPNPFASVDRTTGRVVIKLDDSSIAQDFVNLHVDVEIGLASEPDVQ